MPPGLPSASARAPSRASDSSPEQPPLIWVLDDDERLCGLLCQRLGELGWLAVAYLEPRCLDQALELEVPDLLVLDEMLPGRRGSDLLAGLRQKGYRFPVLMLSAMRSPLDRIAGLEAGADDYLGKPFEFRELQLRLQRLLDSQVGIRGAPPPHAQTYRLASLEFCVAAAELRTAGRAPTRISRGDAGLLQVLCSRPGEVIGRQILARASGSLVDASQSRSIDVRMSRLRRLLEELLPEQGQVIEACRGVGYRLLLHATPLADG